MWPMCPLHTHTRLRVTHAPACVQGWEMPTTMLKCCGCNGKVVGQIGGQIAGMRWASLTKRGEMPDLKAV
jgi:hypothetical protein